MNLIIRPPKIYKFPTREELNKMSMDELYYLASNKSELKTLLIDFLASNLEKKFFVCDIQMSNRLRSILKREQIETFDELTFYKKRRVKRFMGLGPKTQSELEKIMGELNLKFQN